RYEALLKKTGVINEGFLDYRTRVVVRTDEHGNESAHLETTTAEVPIDETGVAVGAVSIEEQDVREQEAEEEAAGLAQQLAPRDDLPPLRIPRLKMTKVELKFSLADITDLDAFEQLGKRLAVEPDDGLRRMELGARIGGGADSTGRSAGEAARRSARRRDRPRARAGGECRGADRRGLRRRARRPGRAGTELLPRPSLSEPRARGDEGPPALRREAAVRSGRRGRGLRAAPGRTAACVLRSQRAV